MKLIANREFNITGRGKVFGINLKENGLPPYSPEFCPLLKGKEVEINGDSYIVWGIELYGIPEDYAKSYKYREIAILVKSK
jgi:hypothetical protein